jgi:HEPN domain-containing protein
VDNNRTEAERWYGQARFDVEAARASTAAGHHEWACFQAQQAGEKALKALLMRQGKRQFLSHSIHDLLAEVKKLAPEFEAVSEAQRLDEYYIPTRYPSGLPGTVVPHDFYGQKEALECVNLAESLLERISRTIGS